MCSLHCTVYSYNNNFFLTFFPSVFRNQKRSLQSSMKPGKRNCERRRQSAWRGQYWQTKSVRFHNPPSIRLCPVSVKQPSITLFPSELSVSLSHTYCMCLISSALILSTSLPLSLSSHSAAHTPISHPFSPFTHSSVTADINHVTVYPLSLSGTILCLLSYHKSLAVMLHTITSHPLTLINTRHFAENKCIVYRWYSVCFYIIYYTCI